jgi:hypothetical protein
VLMVRHPPGLIQPPLHRDLEGLEADQGEP